MRIKLDAWFDLKPESEIAAILRLESVSLTILKVQKNMPSGAAEVIE
jgi:hypothetical protein